MDFKINKRVVKYRKFSHLTQSQVAELIGMKSSTYSQMEREGDVSAERIVKLAEIFNIDVRCLLYDEDVIINPIPPHPPIYELDFVLTNSLKSICKIYNNLPKSKKKCFCEFLNYLRNCNSKELPNFAEIQNGK